MPSPSLASLAVVPPRKPGRPRELGPADVERAQVLLAESSTGWVGTEGTELRTYDAAKARAVRLIRALQESEGPAAKFERRVWQVGSRYFWAIRRVDS